MGGMCFKKKGGRGLEGMIGNTRNRPKKKFRRFEEEGETYTHDLNQINPPALHDNLILIPVPILEKHRI